jgi:acyl carrier protein
VSQERLQQVFRDALGLDASFDVTSLAYSEHERWDSIGHMQLIAAIEEAFGIMIETDDVIGMSSYSKAVEVLRKCGAGQ